MLALSIVTTILIGIIGVVFLFDAICAFKNEEEENLSGHIYMFCFYCICIAIFNIWLLYSK